MAAMREGIYRIMRFVNCRDIALSAFILCHYFCGVCARYGLCFSFFFLPLPSSRELCCGARLTYIVVAIWASGLFFFFFSLSGYSGPPRLNIEYICF